MRELYKLVLKTIREAKRGDIFHIDDLSMTSESIPSFFAAYSDGNYPSGKVLGFTLKYSDGDPDVIVHFREVITTKYIKETKMIGPWWNRTKNTYDKPIENHPIYTIYAGTLKYETTVDEAKILHSTYWSHVTRFKRIQEKKEISVINNRLNK